MKKVQIVKVMPSNMRTRDTNRQYLGAANRSVGSFLSDSGGPYRPLTREEEDKVVASAKSISPSDTSAPKLYRDFWNDLRKKIDGERETFNVPEDADEAVDKHKEKEFCLYRLCLDHPNVANTPEEVNNYQHKFYLNDLAEQKNKSVEQAKVKNAAHKKRAQFEEKPEVLNQVLRVLSSKTVSNMSEDDKIIELDDIIEQKPQEFIETVDDERLQGKAYVKELLELGILEQDQVDANTTQIKFIDTHLGNDLESAAKFINNPKNSEVVGEIKAKYQSKVGSKNTKSNTNKGK